MPDYSNIVKALILENRSELSSLFVEKSVPGLSTNLETLLDEHPNDPVVKLLWSFAQAESQSLPLPFIASSLLELTQNKSLLKEHPRICFVVIDDVSQKLVNVGELRSAIFLLTEFLVNPDPGYFESANEWKARKDEVVNLIDREKDLALKKREPGSYLKSLDEAKKKLEKTKAPVIKVKKLKNESVVRKESEASDSFNGLARGRSDILEKEELRDLRSAKPLDDEFVLGASDTEEHLEIRKLLTSSRAEQKKNRHRSFTLLFLGILILGVTFGLYQRHSKALFFKVKNIFKSDPDTHLVYETRLSKQGESIKPRLKPFSLDSMGPSLDDINKRLARINSVRDDKKEEAEKVGTISTEPSPPATPSIDETEIESLNTVPDKSNVVAPAPIPKLPPPSDVGPPIDLGGNDKVQNPDGGRVLGSSTDPKSIRRAGDGRNYGPPRVNDPAKNSTGQRALDGSNLQSYEVERFDPPLVYETITATNVLAAPSLMSQSITRLKSDTPVHVTAKLGYWLELRSNEGKIGYIFAQDAVAR